MKIFFLYGGINFNHNNRGCQALSYGSLEFINNQYGNDCSFIIPKWYYRRRDRINYSLSIRNGKINQTVEVRYYSVVDILVTILIRIISFNSILTRHTRFGNDIRNAYAICNINGGDSFSDIYGFRQFITLSFGSILAILCGKKSILLPQTIGPFRQHEIIFKIAKFILKNAYQVFIRDEEYISELKKECVNYTVTNDVSYYMKPEKIEIENYKKSIGINISGLAYYNNYPGLEGEFDNYAALIKKMLILLQSKGYSVVLIPHTYNYHNPEKKSDDLASSIKVYNSLENKTGISVLNRDLTAPQLKYVISNFKFFIGTRMHACFAAIYTNTPVFGLAYSYKFSGSFKRYGLGENFANIRGISANDIEIIINKIYDRIEQSK